MDGKKEAQKNYHQEQAGIPCIVLKNVDPHKRMGKKVYHFIILRP